MTPGEIRIGRLRDHTELLADIAALYTAVWPSWYRPDGPGDAAADLTERCRDQGLPCGFVAIVGQRPVGAVALSPQSFGAMAGEGPWLVGLAVEENFRRQGVGTRLIAQAEAAARGYGNWLYCTTDSAAGLLAARGWVDLRRAGEGPDRVYRLTL